MYLHEVKKVLQRTKTRKPSGGFQRYKSRPLTVYHRNKPISETPCVSTRKVAGICFTCAALQSGYDSRPGQAFALPANLNVPRLRPCRSRSAERETPVGKRQATPG